MWHLSKLLTGTTGTTDTTQTTGTKGTTGNTGTTYARLNPEKVVIIRYPYLSFYKMNYYK